MATTDERRERRDEDDEDDKDDDETVGRLAVTFAESDERTTGQSTTEEDLETTTRRARREKLQGLVNELIIGVMPWPQGNAAQQNEYVGKKRKGGMKPNEP